MCVFISEIMWDFKIFCEEFGKLANTNGLLNDDHRALIGPWIGEIQKEYDNSYTIWDDWEGVYELILLIFRILKYNIGESKVVTIEAFIEYLETANNNDYFLKELRSAKWNRFAMMASIELVLDTFQTCLVSEHPDKIIYSD